MGVSWTDSADDHGIPHNEALYAMSQPHHVVKEFGEPRVGDIPPTLFVGPSRFGTLEVLAVIRPPADVRIFHVMRLRESTRISAGYEGE
ncbi:MAG: hypothetical protein DLM58_12920 [Pseudonocardiales bacterium]|nr:MAG: hypothetical protein DLM58_12920 [Pseudonocardiales bacterium]